MAGGVRGISPASFLTDTARISSPPVRRVVDASHITPIGTCTEEQTSMRRECRGDEAWAGYGGTVSCSSSLLPLPLIQRSYFWPSGMVAPRRYASLSWASVTL
jgi:hypothetical protein